MACPYAEQIKGTIAKCTLLNRKVSTMRYPCKGNFRRCPVYIRRGVQREAPIETAQVPRVEEKVEERAPSTGEKQARLETPTPRISDRTKPREAEETDITKQFEPSKSLCDSLVLASLTVTAEAKGIYKGVLRQLPEKLKEYLSPDVIVLVVGDYNGYRMRVLFKGRKVRYSLEKGGEPLCGDRARSILNELGLGGRLEGVVYTVKLTDIPLWRDQITGELK